MLYNLLSAGAALWVILDELLDKKNSSRMECGLRTKCGLTLEWYLPFYTNFITNLHTLL
jgi:hypothetical protein